MNLKTTAFIFFFIPSLASAQWVEDINTESDWEYYYYNGIIDYNSYQLLREIAEGAEISDTLEFITSTLGISPVELLEGYEETATYETGYKSPAISQTETPWSGKLRFGNKLEDETNESYLLAYVKSRKSNIYLKFRNDEMGKTLIERRSFKFEGENYSVTAGNFTSNVGCGLGIGRFDYRPVSLESDEDELNRIIFPDNSYYNGVKAEFYNNHAIIYSIKKYNDVYKNTFGSMISARLSSIQLGITGIFTRLSSYSGARTLGVGSIFINMAEYGTNAEIAYAESGPGACIEVVRPDYVLRGWYYDKSYVNLQSSGFAYPDYQSYTDYRSEISFRQPQRGETGFYARKKVRYKSLEIRSAAELWRNPRNDLINYNNFIQIRLPVTEGLASLLGYYFSRKNGIYRDKFDTGIRFNRAYDIQLRFMTAYEEGTIARDDSRFYMLGSIPLRKSLTLSGRARWNFEGEFDYFIEERMTLSNKLFLKATYRWKEDSGKELGSLYVYMENRF